MTNEIQVCTGEFFSQKLNICTAFMELYYFIFKINLVANFNIHVIILLQDVIVLCHFLSQCFGQRKLISTLNKCLDYVY